MSFANLGGTPAGPRVFHLERAKGVHPTLFRFLEWWSVNGPFAITIPEDGGVRSDAAAQLVLFERGVSRARTLAETPHGRAAAIDAWPAILDSSGRYPIGIVTSNWALLEQYGSAGERFGLAWGGRWSEFKDGAHLEVPGWRSLPAGAGWA